MKKWLCFIIILVIINIDFIYSAPSYTALNNQFNNNNGINLPIMNSQPLEKNSVVEAQSSKGSQTTSALDELNKVMKDKDIWENGEKVDYATINPKSSRNQQAINQLLGQSDNNKTEAPNLGDITARIVDGLKNRNVWDEVKRVSPMASAADQLENFTLDGQYRQDTIDYIIQGDFSKNGPTELGLTLMMCLGFTGADLPFDIRDLTEKAVNWKWTWGHVGNTALTAAAVLPVIGVLKYGKGLMTLNQYNKVSRNSQKLIAVMGKNGKRKLYKHALPPNQRGMPNILHGINQNLVLSSGHDVIIRNGKPAAVKFANNIENFTPKPVSVKDLNTNPDALIKLNKKQLDEFFSKKNVKSREELNALLKKDNLMIDGDNYLANLEGKRIYSDVDYCGILDPKTGKHIHPETAIHYKNGINRRLEEKGYAPLAQHNPQLADGWPRPLYGKNSGPNEGPYTWMYRDVDKNGNYVVRSIHLETRDELKEFAKHQGYKWENLVPEDDPEIRNKIIAKQGAQAVNSRRQLPSRKPPEIKKNYLFFNK